MKQHSKFYKDIENNTANEFASDILYVNNMSLIGFGAKRNIEGSEYFGTIYVDLAIRLDDLKSILKLVYMYEVDEAEYKRFSNAALTMPDRGITGFCPVMVVISDSFIKDKDEYYLYSINGRNDEDDKIYTISFDYISMVKVNYLLTLVKRCIYNGESITYYKSDTYEKLTIDNTTPINLLFTNQYNVPYFCIPTKKKMFETSFNSLILANFKHYKKLYNVYFWTNIPTRDRKKLNHTPCYSEKMLFNMMEEDNSYILSNSINVLYYNKGADNLVNKIMIFGVRRDNQEYLCFEFEEYTYQRFTNSVHEALYK